MLQTQIHANGLTTACSKMKCEGDHHYFRYKSLYFKLDAGLVSGNPLWVFTFKFHKSSAVSKFLGLTVFFNFLGISCSTTEKLEGRCDLQRRFGGRLAGSTEAVHNHTGELTAQLQACVLGRPLCPAGTVGGETLSLQIASDGK